MEGRFLYHWCSRLLWMGNFRMIKKIPLLVFLICSLNAEAIETIVDRLTVPVVIACNSVDFNKIDVSIVNTFNHNVNLTEDVAGYNGLLTKSIFSFIPYELLYMHAYLDSKLEPEFTPLNKQGKSRIKKATGNKLSMHAGDVINYTIDLKYFYKVDSKLTYVVSLFSSMENSVSLKLNNTNHFYLASNILLINYSERSCENITASEVLDVAERQKKKIIEK
jgi:hypothetical protein